MKCVTLMLLSLLPTLGLGREPFSTSQQQDQPTHTLELMIGGSEEPIPSDVRLYAYEETWRLSVTLPDGQRITTDCIMTEQGEIKFQLSRIANGMLANIQFVGAARAEAGFEGSFTAMVDGEVRQDMSGTFALIPKAKP